MLAQLGEHRPYKARVTGSSPVQPTTLKVTHLKILYGLLAQLGEHRPYKARVTGSSPVQPTIILMEIKEIDARIALLSLARRGILAKSNKTKHIELARLGLLAQLGEHRPYKARVTGSSPVQPTIILMVTKENDVRIALSSLARRGLLVKSSIAKHHF